MIPYPYWIILAMLGMGVLMYSIGSLIQHWPEKKRAFRQWVRGELHHRGCDCTPEMVFFCTGCGKRVGWCLGAADNRPTICDFCWGEIEHPFAKGEKR